MKKILALIICALMVCSVFAGCGAKKGGKTGTDTQEAVTGSENDDAPAGRKLDVVTTIFPEYDWVRQIAGDRADITMLLDNGVDLHSYQPTADDIVKIGSCDMFIYVGGESDEWVEDVLAEAGNRDMVVINLLETLGDTVKEEEVKEGMQADEHEHEHEHEHDEDEDHDHEEGDEDHDHEEEVEYDEHVWLSLKNAAVLCKAIAEGLGKADPAGKDIYTAQSNAYVNSLNVLDAKYSDAVSAAKTKTLLFGDRFPFRYLVDDYGLDYYAAFVGCSAETEASFETIAFLAGKVDALGLKAVMQIESADGTIARTVKDTAKTGSGVSILTMDSMQSTTASDVDAGVTYLSVMEKNLDVLKDALK